MLVSLLFAPLRSRSALALGILTLLSTACGGAQTAAETQVAPSAHAGNAEPSKVERAIADVFPKSRSQVKGSLVFKETPEGLAIVGKLKGVDSGSHALTLHASGDCTAHDAKSVGPVWNPGDRQPASGFLGNVVGDDKTLTASVNLVVPGLALEGDSSVLGHAVVLHAWPLDPAADLSPVPFLGCGAIEERAML